MYKKVKKINEAAIDCRLASICEDLLKVNKDAIFAISRKFVENSNGSFKSEVNGNKVIVSSKQIDSLIIPSCLNLVNKNGDFYFMEMNTRIQVEHPITEERTGIDIVKEQIKIAAGETLKLKQKDVEFRGYSMECRINAENPSKNFMPCPGTITGLNLPGGNGVRIDTAIYEGYTIPPTYDSMIAKIITHGDSRNEAISKMKRALEETVIEGVDTNIDFLFKIIKNPNFIRGNFDTSFIEKEILKK